MATDFRLKNQLPEITERIVRTYDEVRRINQGREKSGGVLSRLIAQAEAPPIEVPAAGWEVHVNADRNGTLQERDFVALRDTSLWSKATTREVGSAFADLMDNLGATRAGRPDVD